MGALGSLWASSSELLLSSSPSAGEENEDDEAVEDEAEEDEAEEDEAEEDEAEDDEAEEELVPYAFATVISGFSEYTPVCTLSPSLLV